MIEQIIQKWIVDTTDQITVQELFNGVRPDGDHISWQIVNMNGISQTPKKRKLDNGSLVIDVETISEMTLSVNAYGYQAYKHLMRLSASRYSTDTRYTWNNCISMLDEPVVVNTSYLNDAEHEPRWTGTFRMLTTQSDTLDHYLINQWNLGKCLYLEEPDDNSSSELSSSVKFMITSLGHGVKTEHIHKSANFSINKLNAHYLIDSSSQIIVANMTANPVLGSAIIVTDTQGTSGSNNITIDFGSSLLHGEHGTFTLNCNAASTAFEFVGGSIGWVKMS